MVDVYHFNRTASFTWNFQLLLLLLHSFKLMLLQETYQICIYEFMSAQVNKTHMVLLSHLLCSFYLGRCSVGKLLVSDHIASEIVTSFRFVNAFPSFIHLENQQVWSGKLNRKSLNIFFIQNIFRWVWKKKKKRVKTTENTVKICVMTIVGYPFRKGIKEFVEGKQIVHT